MQPTPAAVFLSLLLLLLWLTPASTDVTGYGAPVKVTVYYETLCPDSKRFIVKQLYPVWSKLQDIVEVDLHAYGKVQKADGKLHCQHGQRECEANLMMTCAKSIINDFRVEMDFTSCVMDRLSGVRGGEACANETGVEFTRVKECMDSKAGLEMQQGVGEAQSILDPTLYYVPWILINGVFTKEQLREAEENLQSVVCSAYTGPKPCPLE